MEGNEWYIGEDVSLISDAFVWIRNGDEGKKTKDGDDLYHHIYFRYDELRKIFEVQWFLGHVYENTKGFTDMQDAMVLIFKLMDVEEDGKELWDFE